MKTGDKVKIKRAIFQDWKREWRRQEHAVNLIAYYRRVHEIDRIEGNRVFVVYPSDTPNIGWHGRDWNWYANDFELADNSEESKSKPCPGCNWTPCKERTNASRG